MQKFKFYFVSLVALATFINVVVPILPSEILPEALETKTAKAVSYGPGITVTVRDLGCSGQQGSAYVGYPGGVARATDSNRKDIDCANITLYPGDVSTSNVKQSIFSYDFRLGVNVSESESGCQAQQGFVAYTGWASDGTVGGSFQESGNGTGSTVAADCVNVYLEFRPLPENRIIRDVRIGLGVGGSSINYTNNATAGGGASSFASGGDFTSARVGIWSVAETVPDDANYISTTIPQNATAAYPTGNPSGSTMGVLPLNSAQNYNIVMKNQGGVWASDSNPISRTVISATPSPTGSNCDTWQPTAAGQTCVEDRVFTSSNYKLRRIDSNSGITTTSGDLSYNRTVRYTYTSFENVDIDCPPPPPPPPDCGGGETFKEVNLEGENSLLDKLFKKANAQEAAPCPVEEPPICTETPNGTYSAGGAVPSQSEHIEYDVNATFPLSLTATVAGDYELRFQMVKTPNALFGNPATNPNTIAIINVRAGSPWSFTCGVNQTVTQGTNANYALNASVPGGYSTPISVTVSSIPAGPAMQTTPVVLTSSSNPAYSGVAVIPTGSLTPNQTYTLTFAANDGSVNNTCQATLLIRPLNIISDLKFNGSDGPVGIGAPPGGGTLTWDTINAASCTGSMQLGADTTPGPTGPWSGPRNTANISAESFAVSGLLADSQYEFKISCSNINGNVDDDFVRVNISPNPPIPPDPTVNIQCTGPDDKSPQDISCNIPSGTAAILTWSSTNAVSCSIDQGIGNVPTQEPVGISTGNLTSPSTDFEITCEGAVGTNPTLDVVTINTYVVVQPPNAPTVSVSNVTCGYIRVTVTPGAVPPPVEGWVVGWGTSFGNIPNTIGGFPTPIPVEYNGAGAPQPLVFYHGTTATPPAGVPASRYAYSPAAAAIGNYYKVAAVNSASPQHGSNPNNWPSGVTTNNGINLVTCQANLDLSDKDIIAVGTAANPTSIYNVPGNPCSGTHEVIPNNRIHKNGEVVTYKINACNSGTQDLTNVSISDTLENLVYVPSSMTAAPAGCATLISQVGSNITFNLSDILAPANPASPTVCSITFRATITAPVGSPSALYRFRNTAILTTAQGVEYLLTPYYLFSLGAGVPDRNETPPQ